MKSKRASLRGKSISSASIREALYDQTPIDPPPLAPVTPWPWGLVYTAPRGEDEACKDLAEHGWDVFCPKMTVWVADRKSIRRRKLVPLFPRYIFVAISEHGRKPIRDCRSVSALIKTERGPIIVPSRVVIGFSDRQAAGEFDQTKPESEIVCPYSVGQVVTLKRGAMEGQAGRIVDISPDMRIRLLMKILGGEVPVDVGLDQIEQAS
jgi:transcription antitermination factor NusG